ncbi:methyltransferase domain-containing protein [Solihabitans fulvus]|uniref:Protein-L-isoaspartate O-methyltransferase n=1 Tax=Solihabitans fulvus TaxID=1892852 RepID=A0A5B2XPT8_9PSEU|nr:ATP-grasp peptide maturase system methyltransferase [Solihabitans fulvus]KAA2264892.1 methyltransferase domain-containing protein [Solihabitans fulvus]
MRDRLDDRTDQLREQLVRSMLSTGALHDPRWSAAFRAVRRHAFLPRFLQQRQDGEWEIVDRSHPRWLARIYEDRVRVTQLDNDDTAWAEAERDGSVPGTPTCSSSMPTIMAIMLELLDAHAGDRVLEIGTGTGYNAALLCHVLGDELVTTVDVDAGLLAGARERLAEAGYHPTCVAADGADGVPARAPYDRVLCTCAVSRIPPAWLAQTVPGGLVVTTLNRPIGAGLVRIVAGDGATGQGRVLAEDGRFMPLRAHRLDEVGALLDPAQLDGVTESRPTDLAADAVLNPGSAFEFFAGLALPDVVAGQGGHGRTWLAHPDGSWVRLRATGDGEHTVEQGGPRRLWDLAEAAYEQWCELGRPRRDRFGITVSCEIQELWLDEPTDPHRWPL